MNNKKEEFEQIILNDNIKPIDKIFKASLVNKGSSLFLGRNIFKKSLIIPQDSEDIENGSLFISNNNLNVMINGEIINLLKKEEKKSLWNINDNNLSINGYKIGIGTMFPTKTVEINGDVKINRKLFVNDLVSIDGAIKIGNYEKISEGLIRYNNKKIQFCDGIEWKDIVEKNEEKENNEIKIQHIILEENGSITNVKDPENDDEIVNKRYVDMLCKGINIKAKVDYMIEHNSENICKIIDENIEYNSDDEIFINNVVLIYNFYENKSFLFRCLEIDGRIKKGKIIIPKFQENEQNCLYVKGGKKFLNTIIFVNNISEYLFEANLLTQDIKLNYKNGIIRNNHNISLNINSQHFYINGMGELDIINIDGKLLKNNSINGEKIINKTINSNHINDNIIFNNHLSNKIIYSKNINDNEIENHHIKNGSISGDKIANNEIKRKNLDFNIIFNEHLSKNCINKDNLMENIINEKHLGKNLILTEHLTSKIINSEHINNKQISKNHIIDRTIDNNCLDDKVIEVRNLTENLIGGIHIMKDEIEGNHLKDNIIDSSHLKEKIINNINLCENSVRGINILDKNIESRHLGNKIICNEHLSNNIINGENIIPGSINGEHIGDNIISSNHLRGGSVKEMHIQNSAITSIKIFDSSVTTEKLANNCVTNNKIANRTITNEKINNPFIKIQFDNYFNGNSMVNLGETFRFSLNPDYDLLRVKENGYEIEKNCKISGELIVDKLIVKEIENEEYKKIAEIKDLKDNIDHIKEKLGKFMPIGSIIEYYGDDNNIPKGWELLDGRNITMKKYPLFFTLNNIIQDTLKLPIYEGQFKKIIKLI